MFYYSLFISSSLLPLLGSVQNQGIDGLINNNKTGNWLILHWTERNGSSKHLQQIWDQHPLLFLNGVCYISESLFESIQTCLSVLSFCVQAIGRNFWDFVMKFCTVTCFAVSLKIELNWKWFGWHHIFDHFPYRAGYVIVGPAPLLCCYLLFSLCCLVLVIILLFFYNARQYQIP